MSSVVFLFVTISVSRSSKFHLTNPTTELLSQMLGFDVISQITWVDVTPVTLRALMSYLLVYVSYVLPQTIFTEFFSTNRTGNLFLFVYAQMTSVLMSFQEMLHGEGFAANFTR